jgi:hypothetical protein
MEINTKWRNSNMEVFLKKQLDEAGFSTTVIEGEILMIENFLTKDEVEEIMSIINGTSEEDWSVEYGKSLKRFCMEKFGRDDVDNLVAEGKYEITYNWYDKNFNIDHYPIAKTMHNRLQDLITITDETLQLAGFATLQRMQPGTNLTSHTDQHTDPSIRYAAILYINDDYNGGNLFFKNKPGISLVPPPGALLLFPGNDEYEHGVTHVEEGPIRYVTVGFIKVKGFYKNNKY